ncbi:MAG: hypothetical protein K6D37_01030 [Prevotella sp.]|nr:hypothetical protein [Prevotella sp.]
MSLQPGQHSVIVLVPFVQADCLYLFILEHDTLIDELFKPEYLIFYLRVSVFIFPDKIIFNIHFISLYLQTSPPFTLSSSPRPFGHQLPLDVAFVIGHVGIQIVVFFLAGDSAQEVAKHSTRLDIENIFVTVDKVDNPFSVSIRLPIIVYKDISKMTIVIYTPQFLLVFTSCGEEERVAVVLLFVDLYGQRQVGKHGRHVFASGEELTRLHIPQEIQSALG